jgi:putative ABC transport system substrate-binding protein
MAADVVVVKSKKLSVYEKAITGFKGVYKGSIKLMVMEGDLADADRLAAAVKAESPKVILAVGVRAVVKLKEKISNIPIVFCMAVHPKGKKLNTKNATGVSLEPFASEQLKSFKKVIPALKKVGIIYDPKRTGTFVKEAIKAAPSANLEMMAVPVSERKEVPKALEKVISSADALWIIRDPTVLTKEFFNHTLIVQFEKKLPLLAYSGKLVEKGAVCSYSSSYVDQGKKAAEIVNSIIGGKSPSDIPLLAPNGTLTVNVNSAPKANVKVPVSVLKNSNVVKVGK